MKIFKAPTKINIVLRVNGLRPNGYHDLLMLNEKLKLSDEIKIEVGHQASDIQPRISITCDDPSVPLDEKNICYKAAAAILDNLGTYALTHPRTSVHIRIKKRIPVAAGLGGGSSDAAATLKGLNELLELRWSNEKLAAIGVKLGADVPFFLYDGPAICEGIGDKITTLSSLPKASFLLLNPGFPVSTKWVYETFDKTIGLGLTPKNQHASLPRLFKGLAEVAKVIHNDLELVTVREYPEIEQIKKLIVKNGAVASWMSGSGPTVIGMFDNEEMCHAAAEEMRKRDANWRVIETSN